MRQSGLVADWQVVTVEDSATATRPLRWVAMELALLGVCLGLPIVLLGRWLSHKLTRPIAELTRVTREIADTDRLEARAPVTSSDELGSLAQSFNRMTDNLQRATREREQFVRELAALNQTLEAKIAMRTEELEAAVKAQQRLIGDISHEIKSPLARLSMALGLARRLTEQDRPRQFDRMEHEIERIAALAGELLTLARLDSIGAPPEFGPVDLGALVERIVADAVYEKPDRASDLVLRREAAPISVLGNADLLRRAIENVVRNAIFYTPVGTRVEIVVSRKPPGLACVATIDHGPGVPAAALDHLFEPFYRVDEARARDTGGSGIGLAICQRVVQLHGGAVAGAQQRAPRPHRRDRAPLYPVTAATRPRYCWCAMQAKRAVVMPQRLVDSASETATLSKRPQLVLRDPLDVAHRGEVGVVFDGDGCRVGAVDIVCAAPHGDASGKRERRDNGADNSAHGLGSPAAIDDGGHAQDVRARSACGREQPQAAARRFRADRTPRSARRCGAPAAARRRGAAPRARRVPGGAGPPRWSMSSSSRAIRSGIRRNRRWAFS